MVDERTPAPRPPIRLEDDPREETTPRERPVRAGSPTDTALRLARAAAIVNQVASILGTDAGKIDLLEGAARAVFLEGEIADVRGFARDLLALMDDIEAEELTSQPGR